MFALSFRKFFSRQARRPSGLFGRYASTLIFDTGNRAVNKLMLELADVREGETVLEIGFGTGTVIKRMAGVIGDGEVHGIDFSAAMMGVARKRNRSLIESGKVHLIQGDFTACDYAPETFDTVCSANTIYFWPDQPGGCARIYSLLKPGGKAVLAFMDKCRMDTLPLDRKVFTPVAHQDVKTWLLGAGFTSVEAHRSPVGTTQYCVVGQKG